MSQLDILTSRSVSGVPMRPKARPAPAPAPDVGAAISQLANVLAVSNKQLADALANVLTSKPAGAVPSDVVPEKPKADAMKMTNFTRGPDGKIKHCVVSAGDRQWRLEVARTGTSLSINVNPG